MKKIFNVKKSDNTEEEMEILQLLEFNNNKYIIYKNTDLEDIHYYAAKCVEKEDDPDYFDLDVELSDEEKNILNEAFDKIMEVEDARV